MNRKSFKLTSGIIALGALLFLAVPSHAEGEKRAVVKWRVNGLITNQANPFTTTAYFPRALAPGELVDMTFTINTTVAGLITGSYARYDGAIKSVNVTGSDWSIRMRAPLGGGMVSVTDDHPDYGDSLDLSANSPLVAGKTWYAVDVNLRNPGGPSPGTGPWAPFTSLALPKTPPSLGLMPVTSFYLSARRDQPGQPFDGAVYYGQVLSITAVACEE